MSTLIQSTYQLNTAQSAKEIYVRKNNNLSANLSDKLSNSNIDNVFNSESFTKHRTDDINQNNIAISFQIMTRSEPVELVKATIESLLNIKAQHDEILIIDNNHNDVELYKPLQVFCDSLDPRLSVRFYHEDHIAGYKSGALNYALEHMSNTCNYIVVVDSDYQALPFARDKIVGAIKRYPQYALLQFPQYYRDNSKGDIHNELNHYFSYHLSRDFNSRSALSTGTYAVIKKEALMRLGGWSGASLTEDAQMGVLMHRAGELSQFIPEVIATGLLPQTLADLVGQRRRWIYGNMQVLCNTFTPVYLWSVLHEYIKQDYFNVDKLKKLFSTKTQKLNGAFVQHSHVKAQLSQLTAWVNFTGVFIGLQGLCLVGLISVKFTGNQLTTSLALQGLAICYVAYFIFMARRAVGYLRNTKSLLSADDKSFLLNYYQRHSKYTSYLKQWRRETKFDQTIYNSAPTGCDNKVTDKDESILKHIKGFFKRNIDKAKRLVAKPTATKITSTLVSRFDAIFNVSKNNKIVKAQHTSKDADKNKRSLLPLSARIKAFLVHISLWELGALSWFPVLWGQQQPFVCTPKVEITPSKLKTAWASFQALPKLLIVLNSLTLILVSAYSLPLFVCALSILLLKMSAGVVVIINFSSDNYELKGYKRTQTSIDEADYYRYQAPTVYTSAAYPSGVFDCEHSRKLGKIDDECSDIRDSSNSSGLVA